MLKVVSNYGSLLLPLKNKFNDKIEDKWFFFDQPGWAELLEI